MSVSAPPEVPEAAIVGAGLAGLAAAFTLGMQAKQARVTIFEIESRIGGRVLTSRQPCGEHGAEFVVNGESMILRFLCSLGLCASDPLKDSACRFEERLASGPFCAMARHTLNEESTKIVIRVLKAAGKANRSDQYPKGDKRGA